MDHYKNRGRNVTTDNYFTSVKLANQLGENGVSLLGTPNKSLREVPVAIKNMKEELQSTYNYMSVRCYHTHRVLGHD